MKKNYFIPGFEPDDIHDMARSALKQIHERKVHIVKGYRKALSGMDDEFLNFNEPYEALVALAKKNLGSTHTAALSAGYELFHQHGAVIDVHHKQAAGVTLHDFDRQLDSADHGNNVAADITSVSKKLVR